MPHAEPVARNAPPFEQRFALRGRKFLPRAVDPARADAHAVRCEHQVAERKAAVLHGGGKAGLFRGGGGPRSGASPLHAFFTVTVPLTLSGLMAGCVLVFIPSTGLFFLNDLLGGSKTMLAGNLIQSLMKSRDLPMASTLSVLMLAVTGVVIALYRKAGGDADGLGLF